MQLGKYLNPRNVLLGIGALGLAAAACGQPQLVPSSIDDPVKQPYAAEASSPLNWKYVVVEASGGPVYRESLRVESTGDVTYAYTDRSDRNPAARKTKKCSGRLDGFALANVTQALIDFPRFAGGYRPSRMIQDGTNVRAEVEADGTLYTAKYGTGAGPEELWKLKRVLWDLRDTLTRCTTFDEGVFGN